MASEHPPTRVHPPDIGQASPPPKLRVLVVDDYTDAADSLCALLKCFGHEARPCYEGAAAIAESQTFHPHVVLLDLGMALLDGYQVAKRLRSAPDGARLVIMALTGFGDTDHRQRAREHFDYFLLKPVAPDDLEKILAVVAWKWVNQAKPQD
jgi:CheY-like chemotaxis protein